MIILIADGGSTKCDWVVADSTNAAILNRFTTGGINPFALSEGQIAELLTAEVAPQISGYNISNAYLYGAGVTPEKSVVMERLLTEHLGIQNTSASSDMQGAARGTIGDGSGIVAILGTGSNTACYQCGEVVDKVAALGYVLVSSPRRFWR